MKKLTAILLLALLSLSLLAGCGSAPAAEPEFDAVVTAIDEAVGEGDNMRAIDADYVKGSMKMDVSGFENWTIKINAFGTNIDEYGVIKAADEKQAAEVEAAVEAYLQMRDETWMPEYMPEEYPKLQAAKVDTNSTYVCYFILADDTQAAAIEAFDGLFK